METPCRLRLAPALQAGQKDDLYESSLMRDHPASLLPLPLGRLPPPIDLQPSRIYERFVKPRCKKVRPPIGPTALEIFFEQRPAQPFPIPSRALHPSLSLSSRSNRFTLVPRPSFKDESHGPGDLDRRRVLDGRPITATYSYRHPTLSVATHSIILLRQTSSAWPEFHIPFSRDLYLHRAVVGGGRVGGGRGASREREHLRRLLPLLNRARLHTARGPRNLAAAASFTSESEAWLEPIQPSGGDSSATGYGATRATRRRRSGPSTILRKIQCRPETEAVGSPCVYTGVPSFVRSFGILRDGPRSSVGFTG